MNNDDYMDVTDKVWAWVCGSGGLDLEKMEDIDEMGHRLPWSCWIQQVLLE